MNEKKNVDGAIFILLMNFSYALLIHAASLIKSEIGGK